MADSHRLHTWLMTQFPHHLACCVLLFLSPAGFTHLQQAQTVRWGHWLMSHASAWQRDDMRLRDLLPRVATLPLGSGALAGNPFLVDRQFIARELGMVGGVCPNSMDAVSDRECLRRERGAGAVECLLLWCWAFVLLLTTPTQQDSQSPAIASHRGWRL